MKSVCSALIFFIFVSGIDLTYRSSAEQALGSKGLSPANPKPWTFRPHNPVAFEEAVNPLLYTDLQEVVKYSGIVKRLTVGKVLQITENGCPQGQKAKGRLE